MAPQAVLPSYCVKAHKKKTEKKITGKSCYYHKKINSLEYPATPLFKNEGDYKTTEIALLVEIIEKESYRNCKSPDIFSKISSKILEELLSHHAAHLDVEKMKVLFANCHDKKTFLEKKDRFGRHIGFGARMEILKVIFAHHPDPESFAFLKDNMGKHMGFFSKTEEELAFIIGYFVNPSEFINTVGKNGKHMGFGVSSKKFEFLLKHCRNPSLFVEHENTKGETVAFRGSRGVVKLAIANCSDVEKFLLHKNKEGLTAAFYAGEESWKFF